MIDVTPRQPVSPILQPNHRTAWRIGTQPIAITAAVLVLLIGGVATIAVWRSYTGAPEKDRVVTARVNQARVAQASEQLVEKTKGLEETQQQSIDQLQLVQDQLQVMTRLLASQQAETRKLTDQVGSLTGALDNLRQSFASIPPEASQPEVRERPRTKASASIRKGRSKAVAQRKRGKTRG
ncbi:hypothetical protein [Tardiphaga sp.]|uniref:hypothetical protein n=1 Tax=Tardiphaga sp. TaxID=1926292 RepID=UPI0026231D91|nr:hypothetical protein [Tardiphaga sp.]MDB5616231.1 hypothetical protein [Tardiphaga sp.]